MKVIPDSQSSIPSCICKFVQYGNEIVYYKPGRLLHHPKRNVSCQAIVLLLHHQQMYMSLLPSG